MESPRDGIGSVLIHDSVPDQSWIVDRICQRGGLENIAPPNVGRSGPEFSYRDPRGFASWTKTWGLGAPGCKTMATSSFYGTGGSNPKGRDRLGESGSGTVRLPRPKPRRTSIYSRCQNASKVARKRTWTASRPSHARRSLAVQARR